MCEATRLILWEPRIAWAEKFTTVDQFDFKIGKGFKTYHGFYPREDRHKITYGVKMLLESQSEEMAKNYLHYKESIKRGYYDRRMDYADVLTTICLHEFCHFIQVVLGKHSKNSIHNAEFYTILDKSHQSQEKATVKEYIVNECQKQNIKIDFFKFATKQPTQNTHTNL